MRTRITKALLSAWLLFHLLVILIIPNEQSYFAHAYRALWFPYANTIGLNSFWQFFSPDPGPGMFIRYELKKDGERLTKDYFPKHDPSYFERLNYIRIVTSTRSIAKNPEALRRIFSRKLCALRPEATSVEIELLSLKIPSLEEVRMGYTLNDMNDERVQFQDLVICEGARE